MVTRLCLFLVNTVPLLPVALPSIYMLLYIMTQMLHASDESYGTLQWFPPCLGPLMCLPFDMPIFWHPHRPCSRSATSANTYIYTLYKPVPEMSMHGGLCVLLKIFCCFVFMLTHKKHLAHKKLKLLFISLHFFHFFAFGKNNLNLIFFFYSYFFVCMRVCAKFVTRKITRKQ